jgi:hypothetical protein
VLHRWYFQLRNTSGYAPSHETKGKLVRVVDRVGALQPFQDAKENDADGGWGGAAGQDAPEYATSAMVCQRRLRGWGGGVGPASGEGFLSSGVDGGGEELVDGVGGRRRGTSKGVAKTKSKCKWSSSGISTSHSFLIFL